MKQSISPTTAIVVILLALLVFALVFSRPHLAPEGVGVHTHDGGGEPDDIPLPQEPPLEEQELANARKGLQKLGISAVLPPLPQDRRQGARVAIVTPSGLGAQAGLKPGDLVTEFNGDPIVHPLSLASAMERVPEDKPSTMVVERGGKQVTLTVTGLKPVPLEERLRPY